MQEICRTCLTPSEQMENIFKSGVKDKKYSELLAACSEMLRLVFDFCQKCRESDESLRTPKFSKAKGE
jgi:plasmid replication initiation protein